MARPSIKEPVVICSKAAQRLAAIYRQHRPEQPALALLPQHSQAFAENQRVPVEQTSSVRTAVLDAPLSYTSTSPQPKITDWQNLRDVHSELYVTCHTLRSLQLLHGTLVEVIPLEVTSDTPLSTLSKLHSINIMSAGICFSRQLRDCSPGQDPCNRCGATHSHPASCTAAKPQQLLHDPARQCVTAASSTTAAAAAKAAGAMGWLCGTTCMGA